MKNRRALLIVLLVFALTPFYSACQRSRDNVQAAREDHSAPAVPPDNDRFLTAQEREMAMKLQQDQLAQIDEARLAEQRSTNNDVKSLANTIAEDNSSALKDLQKIMSNRGANESTHSKSAEEQAMMAKLDTLSGAEFDREFVGAMVSDQQRTLDALRSAEASVQNSDFKDYINNQMEKVRKQLDKAQDVQNKL